MFIIFEICFEKFHDMVVMRDRIIKIFRFDFQRKIKFIAGSNIANNSFLIRRGFTLEPFSDSPHTNAFIITTHLELRPSL